MSDLSFVRTEMVPERAPPATSIGIIGWLRENLFKDWLNTILTILAVFFLYRLVAGLLPWFISPTWNATSVQECRALFAAAFGEHAHERACWGVLRERWPQLLFGRYPVELYWRPILAFILMWVAVAPVLFVNVSRKLLVFSLLYPFVAFWLLWGGTIFLPLVVLFGFYLTASIYNTVINYVGNLLAGIIGLLFPVWWFIYAVDPITAYLSGLMPWFALQEVISRDFGGFMLSLTIGFTGIVISFPLGVLLALGRQSNLPILKMFCVGFIEFIRGVPLITLLFVASALLNYFLPPGTSFDIILRVMIMVTLFAAAYMAEVVRGGLAALPKGQYEAADSLGLNYAQAMQLIIMPQALKISIPAIVTTFIGLFKDTTLVSIIGLIDPLGMKTAINGNIEWAGLNWEIYGFIAFIFFIFCFSMSRYSIYLEKKLATGHR